MNPSSIWRENRVLLVIIGIGLISRLTAAIYLGNSVEILPGTFDQVSYHKLALRVSNGFGFSFGEPWWPLTKADAPTAHWSYLYTGYLALLYRIFGSMPIIARLMQAAVVGVLHSLIVFLIGRHTFSKSVGLIAAGLTVVYSYFIYYSATLMTEPFYITGILAGLYITIRLAETDKPKQQLLLSLFLGIVLSVTVLLRQLFLLLVPVFLLWYIWAFRKNFGRLPIWSVFLIMIVIGFMIAPFTIFNFTRFDQFVLLNTNAGYAFFWANHPIYGTQFEPILPATMGSYQALIPTELRHLSEAELDRELLGRGLQFILDDPIRYLQLSFSRIPIYFMFWPSADSSFASNVARVFSFGIMWPFMLYGMIQAGIRRLNISFLGTPTFLLILFAGSYTLIHLLSWTLIRYRLPVDAVMLIFAAVAVVKLASLLRDSRLSDLVAPASRV